MGLFCLKNIASSTINIFSLRESKQPSPTLSPTIDIFDELAKTDGKLWSKTFEGHQAAEERPKVWKADLCLDNNVV